MPEPRMLVDGTLVEGPAGTFPNVNPATEEIIGEVADASPGDVHRAIDAARLAFDETGWSTDAAGLRDSDGGSRAGSPG
jgi:aldehyde dehydrogenase (NAD+)